MGCARRASWLGLLVLAGCGTGPIGIRAESNTPQYLVFRRGADPIVVDGRLDDPGWSRVDATQPFVTMAGTTAPAVTQARFVHDDQCLYVAVQCSEPIGERLELRVDADRNGEPSFSGVVLPTDAAASTGDWQRAWLSSEHAWIAEIAIPWRLFADAPRSPPSPGDRWQVSIACSVPHAGEPLSESWVRSRRAGDAGFGLLEFASRSAP